MFNKALLMAITGNKNFSIQLLITVGEVFNTGNNGSIVAVNRGYSSFTDAGEYSILESSVPNLVVMALADATQDNKASFWFDSESNIHFPYNIFATNQKNGAKVVLIKAVDGVYTGEGQLFDGIDAGETCVITLTGV